LHRIGGISQNNTNLLLGISYSNILEVDIFKTTGSRGVTMCKWVFRPAYTAWVSSAEIIGIALLGRTNPNRPLLRLIHIDIFICNITHQARIITSPELHVNSLKCVVHISISEGNITVLRSRD